MLAAAVVACSASLPSRVVDAGVPGAAIVPLDDDLAVAARVSGQQVEVVGFVRVGDAWTATVIGGSSVQPGGANSVHLFGWEGEGGWGWWNSFAYGTAAASVSRVVIDGLAGEGGRVVGGAWVIAIRAAGVQPRDLRWRFLDAAGAVVTAGTGIQ